MALETFSTPREPCPTCGKPVDRVSNLYGAAAPEAGQLGCCIRCGGIHRFVARPDGELTRVALDAAEFAELPAEVRKQIHVIRAALRQLRANKAPNN